MAWREKGFANRFVTMEVHGVTDCRRARLRADLHRATSWSAACTSGGYGWRLGKSLALGMVRPELGEIGTELEIAILGERRKVTIVEESPFDPQNERLRG